MPCDSSVSQTVLMNVTAGSLPEGFCPSSMQELFDAMVARMIVTPNQAFTSFAAGSVEPTSNVGPWLKDCEVWFVFDPSTGSYVPMRDKGFDTMLVFESSSTFVVPDFVFKLRIQAWGGGGGGADNSGGVNGAGGGGGGYGLLYADVVPGQSIPIVVGAGGTNGTPGTGGGNTTILTMVANGGAGATSSTQGAGGTATGATLSVNGTPGVGTTSEPAEFVGIGGSSSGGGGGGSHSATNAFANGVVPGGGGAGGAGAGFASGGAGAHGRVTIEF